MTIRSDELRRCIIVYIRDKAGEVLGKSQEVKNVVQMVVVHRGEGTFEVEVTEDNVLLVGVSVLRTKAEVSDRLMTEGTSTEPFLLRAEDLASLDVIRSKGYDTSSPKLIKSIG